VTRGCDGKQGPPPPPLLEEELELLEDELLELLPLQS
jgi:hypothetical protein